MAFSRLSCLLLGGGLVACGSGSGAPTTPSSSPTPSAPAATVAGVWDVALPDDGLVLTLSENAGSVSGTLENPDEEGSIPMAGTISAGGQMALTGQAPDGTRVTLQANVDAARRSFAGSIQFASADLSVTLPITGAKRPG